jgi:1-acyl-sn-glycerol-3-phosphate acyltransferase
MAEPYVPAFVTRRRYARWIPAVSPCIRALECPIVDPKRDPRGAVELLRQAATVHDAGLLIYPESHRSRDGEVRPFRPAGVLAVLGTPDAGVVWRPTGSGRADGRGLRLVSRHPRPRRRPFEPPAADQSCRRSSRPAGEIVDHLALMVGGTHAA